VVQPSLENSLAVSHKVRQIAYGSAIPHKRNENLCLYKNQHMNVSDSFIHNHQKLEMTQMFFHW
jgi:hypothetical protein